MCDKNRSQMVKAVSVFLKIMYRDCKKVTTLEIIFQLAALKIAMSAQFANVSGAPGEVPNYKLMKIKQS